MGTNTSTSKCHAKRGCPSACCTGFLRVGSAFPCTSAASSLRSSCASAGGPIGRVVLSPRKQRRASRTPFGTRWHLISKAEQGKRARLFVAGLCSIASEISYRVRAATGGFRRCAAAELRRSFAGVNCRVRGHARAIARCFSCEMEIAQTLGKLMLHFESEADRRTAVSAPNEGFLAPIAEIRTHEAVAEASCVLQRENRLELLQNAFDMLVYRQVLQSAREIRCRKGHDKVTNRPVPFRGLAWL
mmetsp:Transcript_11124/g.41562  ORF Transcript_11124/g.41562 Transcript_11124/m.41562 type:complete len:245 (+) Transcript_11124:132-866(+)